MAPRLVCMVEFNEITPDKNMRALRFKGIRTDKAPEDYIIVV